MQVIKDARFTQSVDAIFHAYTDEAFLRKKMIAFGARNIEIEIFKEADTVEVEIVREMPVEVPGPLKKFAKPWNKITQRELWKGTSGGPYTAQMEIEIHGVPASVRGAMELMASEDGGCFAASITEVDSNIPFLGKVVQKFVSEESQRAVNDELDYVRQHA